MGKQVFLELTTEENLKKLIEAGISELKEMNFDKMVIGCLVGNPSNEFYKQNNKKYIKQRIF